jgi:hypothetical protein
MEALQIADNATLREIQARISGNSAVGNSVSSLLGNLTKAYTLSAAQDSGGNLQNALYRLGLASQSGDMSKYLSTFDSEGAGINYLDVPAPTFDTPTLDVGNIDLNAAPPDIQFEG